MHKLLPWKSRLPKGLSVHLCWGRLSVYTTPHTLVDFMVDLIIDVSLIMIRITYT